MGNMDFSGQLIRTMKPRNIVELAIINAAIRPAGSSYRDNLTHRIKNVTSNHNVDALFKDSLGYCVFQEDIMQFLQKFCGFSGSASDNIRRAIGAKDEKIINETVPLIIEGYCSNSKLPYDKAKEEAEQYVEVIKDASSYAFNKSHAVAYSMLGYLFAYMRYHHPKEFVCAFLNYADNEDDIINGTNLIKTFNFNIQEPKFRYGRSLYMYDENTNNIYKGMSSIKYLNDKIAEELYLLRNNSYNNFFELLQDIKLKTKLTKTHLDILIRLDYFSEFGNSNFLSHCVDMYNYFKQGELQYISKDKLKDDVLSKIILRYSEEQKTRYHIIDYHNLFSEIYELLQSCNYPDLSIQTKINTQMEYLGYISIKTNRNEDRGLLLVQNVKALIAKKGKFSGKAWAYVVTTYSFGRGINGEFMIHADVYNKLPLKKGQIIYTNINTLKREKYNDKTQWWITNYQYHGGI